MINHAAIGAGLQYLLVLEHFLLVKRLRSSIDSIYLFHGEQDNPQLNYHQ